MTHPAAPDPALAYRPNVGAALFNRAGEVLIARRREGGPDLPYPWQLPQGGIDPGEDPAVAVLRELREEIGTDAAVILGAMPEWLTYDFPAEIRARHTTRHGAHHRGQRQLWFALRFTGTDDMIRLDADPHPEFSAWRWAALADIPPLAVPFKRHIYDRIASEFAVYTNPEGD